MSSIQADGINACFRRAEHDCRDAADIAVRTRGTDELAPERKSSPSADWFEQRERNALLRDAEQMEQRRQPR